MCTALISSRRRVSEGVTGSSNKAILTAWFCLAVVFCFVFLNNKGQFTEVVKQTTAVLLK